MIWYILSGIAIFLLTLLCIPIRLIVLYKTESEPQAFMRWLFWKVDLTTLKKPKRPVKKKEKKTPAPQETTKKKRKKTPEEQAGMIHTVLALLSSSKTPLARLLRRFRFYKIELHIVIAKDDAAQTAISYGQTNTLIYSCYALAQGFLNMAQPHISVRPNFVAQQGDFSLDVRGRLAPISIFGAAFSIAIRFLIRILRRTKQDGSSPQT